MSRMSKKRKQENIFDFTLTDDEIAEITNLDKCTGYYNRADDNTDTTATLLLSARFHLP